LGGHAFTAFVAYEVDVVLFLIDVGSGLPFMTIRIATKRTTEINQIMRFDFIVSQSAG
jgi:hypothetical protein